MANNNQKAQLHILKADLGLSREEYEGLLAPYGVNSSADPAFTVAKADALIGTMRSMADGRQPADAKAMAGRQTADRSDQGWGKEKFEYLRPRPAHLGDPKQLRKIEAMWRDVARDPSDKALASFLKRQCGKRNIIWLEKPDVEAVICALEVMKSGNGQTANGSQAH